jgi:hypothetical protein
MNRQLLVALVSLVLAACCTGRGHAQWSTNGLKIFYNDGNVGIGTNDPAFTLEVFSLTARAVSAVTDSPAGNSMGVYAKSKSPDGYGVYAISSANSGNAIGLLARTNSNAGYAGYFLGGRNYFQGNVGIGSTNPLFPLMVINPSTLGSQASVVGTMTSTMPGPLSAGVRGINRGTSVNGVGVWGEHDGDGYGVYGTSDANGYGVYGLCEANGIGVLGEAYGLGVNYGVYGFTNSNNGYAGFFEGGRSFFEGAVGLGVTNPSFQLHLSANSAAKPTSNAWTVSSDARLKKNITPIDGALEQLLALNGVTYQWKDPASQGNMAGTYTGMIAQDVEKVFPEWINEDARGYKTLTVIGFEGIVVEALRDLRAEKDLEIDELRIEKNTQIAELRAENDALRQMLLELRADVEAVKAKVDSAAVNR